MELLSKLSCGRLQGGVSKAVGHRHYRLLRELPQLVTVTERARC